MWNTSNQRIKALMSSRAREKMRRSRPIHVDRTPVRIAFKLASGEAVEAQARVVLSELTVDGVVLYSAEPLAPNTEVTMTITNPEKFEIKAKIIWCQYQDSAAKIITQNAFPYRMGVAFGWEKEEDKTRFDNFSKMAKHHYDEIVVPAPKIEAPILASAPTGSATVDAAAAVATPPTGDATVVASVTPIGAALGAAPVEAATTPTADAPKTETATGENPAAASDPSNAKAA